jgi:hypothetical protein
MLFYSLVVGRTGTVAPLKHASIYVACARGAISNCETAS